VLRETEVEDLDASLTGHEDICRFDVAVNDPFRMRVCERSAICSPCCCTVATGNPSAGSVAERVPINQLHHDERLIVVVLDLVHRADAGMVQSRRGSRFVQDAFRPESSGPLWKQLDGDIPLQLLVVGAIHGAHATSAQLGGDAITANLLQHLSCHASET
jgi:hypothetical protein